MTNVQAASPEIEAQFTDAIQAVVIEYTLKHPIDAPLHLLMAKKRGYNLL
jgi:hypothetical protein